MYKDDYFDIFPLTANTYHPCPRLWLNNNGTILNIISIDYIDKEIIYEWIDLRAPFKWNINTNVNILAHTMWEEDEIRWNLSIITCQ